MHIVWSIWSFSFILNLHLITLMVFDFGTRRFHSLDLRINSIEFQHFNLPMHLQRFHANLISDQIRSSSHFNLQIPDPSKIQIDTRYLLTEKCSQ